MEPKSYIPYTDEYGRSQMRAKVVARNGAEKQIYLNSLRVDPSRRTYLFAYLDPRRQTSNPAGLVQFSDTLKTEPSE